MNNKTYTSAKPFVKWVGGKTQLLEDIKRALPTDFSQNIETSETPYSCNHILTLLYHSISAIS